MHDMDLFGTMIKSDGIIKSCKTNTNNGNYIILIGYIFTIIQ